MTGLRLGPALALTLGCSEPPTANRRLWAEARQADAEGVQWATTEATSWEVAGPLTWSAWVVQRAGATGATSVTVTIDGAPATTVQASEIPTVLKVPVTGSAVVAVQADPGVLVAAPEVYRPTDTPRRVVVVMVDTLRADHLGAWGYLRPTSPRLDAIAAQGTRWDRCLAPSPWTVPSTRVLLTGAPHREFGQATSMLERLGAAGWATGAITRNPWLTADNGVGTGAAFHDGSQPEGAAAATDRALRWLDAVADRDAALFLQHMDPHVPYAPSLPLPDDLTTSPVDRPDLTPERRAQLAEYDGEIRSTDAEIGRLWDHLRALHGESLLVVTADHGEEFWEHGGFEHGHSLYAELLHVPLLMAGDRVRAGHTETLPVSLQDIAPTVLSWAGLPDSGGRDLLPTGALPDQPLLVGETIAGGPAWGVATDGYRYWVRNGREHLFTSDDPTDAVDHAATADLAPFRAILRERFGIDVRLGGALMVPRRALLRRPDLRQVTIDWGASVLAAKAVPADAITLPDGAAVRIDGARTTLAPGSGSAGVIVVFDQLPTGSVSLAVNEDPAVPLPADPDRRHRLRASGGVVPLVLGVGRVPWVEDSAGNPPPIMVPHDATDALRVLGYIDSAGGTDPPLRAPTEEDGHDGQPTDGVRLR